MTAPLIELDPAPTLVKRLRAELGRTFDASRPVRLGRSPGRLDVMGGIADFTGSLVCQMTLGCAAVVALQERGGPDIQIFSFNLLDRHQPFTFGMPLAALAQSPLETLRREFAQPGRKWASYMAGVLGILHQRKLVDLLDPKICGLNIAVLSTVPMGAGVASSAAIEMATLMALRDHFGLAGKIDGLAAAAICQEAENQIAGVPCGIMDQVACCLGKSDSLLRLVCQPHELRDPISIPPGMCFFGIDSGVSRQIGSGRYPRSRCAAFMGHRIIIEKMRDLGKAQGSELIADPMRGYLANLDPDDYKRFFRPFIPEVMTGRDFTARFGQTIDPQTQVEADVEYHVQQAADHHVLEARRVVNFAEYIERSLLEAPGTRQRGSMLDRAGHLMYASHVSYANDALLGDPACDLLVDLVRRRESRGLYGARITGGGCGGTVAVLSAQVPTLDQTIAEILDEYRRETGNNPQLIKDSSPGAWETGSALIHP